MLSTRRFLVVVTVAAGATLGGFAAWAVGSLGGLPEATGGVSAVTPAGGW
jgi:hypothetical protein